MISQRKRSQVILFFSTGCYSGYLPLMPGTYGTMVGVCLYLLLSPFFSPLHYLIITGLLFIGGVWIAGLAEEILGRKDAEAIVIDEIVGFLVTMLFLPKRTTLIVLGFLLFRMFDIWKPFRRVEQLPGGAGVMLDDLLAALCANLLLHFMVRAVG
ncbi:MAG: phosphatidylglycerophosphatase A [Candidatus Tectomicrobia bacterium]|nr:phosphatidylglycerophosphatase A [Candidatus Tectomicrobia bacterium]